MLAKQAKASTCRLPQTSPMIFNAHSAPHPMQPYFKSRGYVPGGVLTNQQNVEFHMEHLPPFLRTLLVPMHVTKSLEAFFWEQVRWKIWAKRPLLAHGIPPWSCRPGATVLERRVRLMGMESGREFAQAHSWIKLEALPAHLREDCSRPHRHRRIAARARPGNLSRDPGCRPKQCAGRCDLSHLPHPDPHQPAILITETFHALFIVPDPAALTLANRPGVRGGFLQERHEQGASARSPEVLCLRRVQEFSEQTLIAYDQPEKAAIANSCSISATANSPACSRTWRPRCAMSHRDQQLYCQARPTIQGQRAVQRHQHRR